MFFYRENLVTFKELKEGLIRQLLIFITEPEELPQNLVWLVATSCKDTFLEICFV